MSAPAAEGLRGRARRWWAPLLIVAPLLVLACNDGNGVDPIVFGCLTFTADAAPAIGAVATLDGSPTACEIVQVDLVITDVGDVFSVSFDAVFDPAVVAFQDVSTAGSVLESDGAATSVLINTISGRVGIGLTRVSNSGVDAIGTQLLITLVFVRVAPAGVAALTFEQPQILGSETPPQPKPGIPWSGGVIQVG